MYAGMFIEGYVKNMTFKEHNSGRSKSQMECDTKIEAR